MIEKNQNVVRDSKIKQLVEYSDDSKQINILDQRFYRRNGEHYPSVSYVLNFFPKNQYFHNWLKEVGFNSEIIVAKAAAEGTQVHNAIDRFLQGYNIEWLDQYGNAQYSLEVWKMILKFAEFWNTYKPELIASEIHLFSDNGKYAGTADLVVKIENKIWLIDIKTSNSLHTSYNLQLAAYAKAWNEMYSEPIEETGILWLKASTRGPDKTKKKIQGDGWQLKQIGEIDKYYTIFQYIYEIFKLENPDSVPVSELIPTSVKIN